MASYDYFISYSRHDQDFASQLARALGRHGIRGFLDKADISAGAEWGVSIKAAIEQSHAMIVILSPSTTTSNWVMAEVGMAQALEKLIIPVLAPGARLDTKFYYLLDRHLAVDAGKISVEETCAQIIAAIKGISIDDARYLLPSSRRRRKILWAALIATLIIIAVMLYCIWEKAEAGRRRKEELSGLWPKQVLQRNPLAFPGVTKISCRPRGGNCNETAAHYGRGGSGAAICPASRNTAVRSTTPGSARIEGFRCRTCPFWCLLCTDRRKTTACGT